MDIAKLVAGTLQDPLGCGVLLYVVGTLLSGGAALLLGPVRRVTRHMR
jgi:hypothetical protein